MAYNKKHGITPKTIIKDIKNTLQISTKVEEKAKAVKKENIPKMIEDLKAMMKVASANLDFEKAIELRDEMMKLKKKLEK